MNLLKYDMKQSALKNLTNDRTIQNYKRNIDMFCQWAKAVHHIRLQRDIVKHPEVDTPQKLIQKYEEYLEKEYPKKLSPAAIHTYLAPICKAFGVKMDEIQKPLRKAADISKCRDEERNTRGKKEMEKEQNARLIAFEKAVGLRRNELKKLPANALQKDVCGHDCIVIKGKGGKVQRQRILPQDLALVQKVFSEKKGTQKIFESAELKNHISLHTLRAEHARTCYDYYQKLCRNGQRDQLKKELLKTFDAYHIGDPNSRQFQKQREIFLKDMTKDGGQYHVRGDNVQRAKAAGRPLVYDRVALMCTSVWHLAHWRVNVTVTNYML